MTWEDNEVVMKPHGLLKEIDVQQHIYRMHAEDLPTILKAGSRKVGKFLTQTAMQYI